MKLRSIDEMMVRYRRAGDPFGWEREILSRYMTETEARGTVPNMDRWAKNAAPRTIDQIVEDATTYLDYAWGPALEHRNVLAQRSAFKLDYMCWMLGATRLGFAEIDVERRGLFFVGALRAVAEFLGADFPPSEWRPYTDQPAIPLHPHRQNRLARMADGVPCIPACPDGCLWKPPATDDSIFQ